jgi:hypothetical protein
MSEFALWMKKEQHGTLSALAQLEIGSLDTVPLLVAPMGGVTLLRLHILPRADYAISGSNYWTLSLKVRDSGGVEIRTIALAFASLAILPFGKNRTMTWPSVGRFDERINEGETVWLQVDETGTASGFLGAQLDYLLAGR